MNNTFTGFNPETFKFLMELDYNNEKSFFDANRQRYIDNVKIPLALLTDELLESTLEVDPDFNTRHTRIISRINRDTRYSRDKRPYRDHAWLSFRRTDTHISTTFSLYFEIDTRGYGYGMGMYNGEPDFMQSYRARLIADPERFLSLANDSALSRYRVEGDMFKRDRFPDAPERIKPYINRKGISWCFYEPSLKNTMTHDLVDEVKSAITEMKPMYRFIMGMEM